MFYLSALQCWCVLLCFFSIAGAQNQTENEIRPYEFAFNIVDFQHRSEKKDAEGLIEGEYGFVTLDGIYHETAYVVDKDGDFIITKMRHRRITSLKDPEEIFRDKPAAAKKLMEALAKACASCDIPELEVQESGSFVTTPPAPLTTTIATTTIYPTTTYSAYQQPQATERLFAGSRPEKKFEKKLDLAKKEMIRVLKKADPADNYGERNSRKDRKQSEYQQQQERLSPKAGGREAIVREMVEAGRKVLKTGQEGQLADVEEERALLEEMANDLFYQFNYTVLRSHKAREEGFRDGRKDGEYNAKFREGVDTHVRYVSNEFGYQPNITLVPRQEELYSNETTDQEASPRAASPYQGPYFSWLRK